MSRVTAISIGVVGLWSASVVAFAARPSPATQLFQGCFSGCGGLWIWVPGSHPAPLASPVWTGNCPVVDRRGPGAAGRGRLGWGDRLRRSLPNFESIVHRMDSGAIPVTAEWRRFPEAEGGFTRYRHNEVRTGKLTVEFSPGGVFQ